MARHNRKDDRFAQALESFEKIGDGRTTYKKLFTSDYILDEAVTGCRQRTRNHGFSVELGTWILSSESVVMLWVDESILMEAWDLYRSRKEISLSLTDCTSAILARRQGITDIFTFDSDFRALGFRVLDRL